MDGNHKENHVAAKTIFTGTFLAALFLSSGMPSVKAAGPDNSPRMVTTQQQKNVVKGAITDTNGEFSIEAPIGSMLEVSYIGMETRAIKVINGKTLTINLKEDSRTVDEVVVTAMGIKKERKALGYAVTDLKATELMKNKNTNVINSLAGKVPGLNITQSSGAAGAGASIVMRGANSTAEGRSNQPLFVVDGIIYDNSTSVIGNSGTDGMTRNATTFSNRVMDINPEDIADISVLKGAAAAALYGSRAADGAIIITTKKGAEGTVKVDYSGKISGSWATKLPETQKQFGRGVYTTNGVFSDQTYESWGKAYDGTETLYDNSATERYLTTTSAYQEVPRIRVSTCHCQTTTSRVSSARPVTTRLRYASTVSRNTEDLPLAPTSPIPLPAPTRH